MTPRESRQNAAGRVTLLFELIALRTEENKRQNATVQVTATIVEADHVPSNTAKAVLSRLLPMDERSEQGIREIGHELCNRL